MTHTPATPATADQLPTNALFAVVRFLRLAWYRRGIVLCGIVIGGLLGLLYYTTAERKFPSKASVLILQPNALAKSLDGDMGQRDLMPTYQKLVTSEKVVKEAIRRLPVEHRRDLLGVSKSRWADFLAARLTVKSVRLTNILEISYQSSKPQTAQAVVNAVLSSYIDFMDKTHQQTAHDVLQVLTREKAELEFKLNQQEQMLLAAKRSGEVLEENGVSWNVVLKRAEALNAELVLAQRKRIEIESQLVALDGAVRRGDDLMQFLITSVDTLGLEFMRQQFGLSSSDAFAVARMQQQLLDDSARLQNLQQHLGENHPKVVELASKIRTTQEYLGGRRQASSEQLEQLKTSELGPMLLQMTRQKYLQAVEQEQRLRRDFEAEKERALDLNTQISQIQLMELDLKRLRAFYDVILDRIKTVDMSKENDSIRATIVSEPQIPISPVWPQLKTVMAMFLALGLGTGLAMVYLLDLLDDRFRAPEEIQLQLRVQILAMVRKMDPLPGSGAQTLCVQSKPNGVEAEAFRTLRTSLGFMAASSQRIVVSSSEPGDGKTTVMANLAVAFTQSGKRTLLIDADMRRPGSTNLFELRSQGGLSTVLRSPEPIDQAITPLLRTVGVEGLDFLPCGPRPANPSELLSGVRMSDLLAWAETRYDQVLIDAPPTLACADAAIIGRMVDGVVLVVRPEKNRRRMVIRAVDNFTSVGINLFGVVLNQLSAETGHEYYGYGYGNGYGYGYGSDDAEAVESAASAPSAEEAAPAALEISDYYRNYAEQQDAYPDDESQAA